MAMSLFSMAANSIIQNPTSPTSLQKNLFNTPKPNKLRGTTQKRHSNPFKQSHQALAMANERHFWLLKTEPGEWSWEDQASNGGVTKWDGVRNKQAQKNLKSMKINDLCFFYHSGASARQIVGVVTVIKDWYADEENEVVVDVRAIGLMRRPVELKEMKTNEELKVFDLFRQPRLSVVPVPEEFWKKVCDLAGGFEGDDVGN